MTERYDLIVVGNGILGNAVAFAIARASPGLRIALIGPRQRPGSASAAAGAMLNVFGEIEAGSLDHPLQRYKFDLARQALALWPAWHGAVAAAAGLPGEAGVTPGTTILKPAGAAAGYAALRSALEEAGEPYRLVDPRAMPGYDPAVERANEAIHIPREGRIDPRRLLALFERSFARTGAVEPVDEEAVSLSIGTYGLKSAQLRSGTALTAPQLVIAAGARSSALIDSVPALQGRVPRLLYGVGIGLLFETGHPPPPHVLRAAHPDFDHGIHLVPQDDGGLYIGSTSDVVAEPDYAPRADRVAALQEAAVALFDGRLAGLAPRVLLGFRPVTEDGFPLIGETGIPGLFVLSGTRRDGLHLSPLYAADMAQRVLEGRGFIAGFEPERVSEGRL